MMSKSQPWNTRPYRQRAVRRRRYRRILTCLAAVVVFCTTYALTLPAITMEHGCALEEHTHTQACYTQVTSRTVTAPVCDQTSLGLHVHDETCLDSEGNLICGDADFLVHRHDSRCYDENGVLWCPLEEIEAHTHGPECYGPAHVHTDACYTRQRGELQCTLHAHTDECYTETSSLVCTLEEREGHTHGEACYNEAGELTCQLEECEGHTHGESCYETLRTLTCGQESDHVHTDDCYSWTQELSCTLSTEEVLLCEKEEIVLHTHIPWVSQEEPGCYDEDGNLVCGQVQVLEHQHTDACFQTREEPVDTEALTCTIPEGEGAHTHGPECYDESGAQTCTLEETPGHQHGPLCYGQWTLTCTLEEHTHGDDCVPQETTDPTQESTEPQLEEQTLQAQLYTDETYAEQAQDQQGTVEISGLLPPGVEVRAYPVTLEVEGRKVLAAYDITLFLADGTVYEPEQPVTVRFILPQLLENVPAEDLAITHVEDDGTQTQVDCQVEDSAVRFEAAGFSTYAVTASDEVGVCDCGLEDGCLTWTDSSDTNPFGGAGAYNLFLFGDLTKWNDVEGNVAVQGDLAESNGGITYHEGATNTSTGMAIPRYKVGLLLGGKLTDGLEGSGVNVLNGNVICSSELKRSESIFGLHTFGDHVHGVEASKIQAYFEAAKSDLVEQNRTISEMESTGSVYIDEKDGTVTLRGSNDFLNVFTLTADAYKAATSGSEARKVYLDVPFGSYVIINVQGSGTVADFAPRLYTKNSSDEWTDPSKASNDDQIQSRRILWNFSPAITRVDLKTGFYLYGSVLAPNMGWNIAADGIYVGVDGTAVLAWANGNGTASEFHYNPYIPAGKLSIEKAVTCDEHEDCGALKNLGEVYVRVKLEDITYAAGDHPTYECVFQYGQVFNIPAIAPGKYKVTEVSFYTKDAEDQETPVVIEGHAFVNATFGDGNTGSTTVAVTSGSDLSVKITNHYNEGDYTSVNLKKVWLDPLGKMTNNVDVKSITVQLYRTTNHDAPNVETDDKVREQIVITAADGWQYQWTGLPKDDGRDPANLYYYYVREVLDGEGIDSNLDGYEVVVGTGEDAEVGDNRPVASGDYTIYNRKKMQVEVEKFWEDNNGNPIEAPQNTQIQITLFAVNGEEKTRVEHDAEGNAIENPITLPLADESWKYTWENLKPGVTYTVEESDCPDLFTPKVEGSGFHFTVTNKKAQVYEMTVTKAWQEADGTDITSGVPAVQVQLYQYCTGWCDGKATTIIENGSPYGDPVWLAPDNNWTHTWSDLPKQTEQTENRMQCYYAAKEVSDIPGFTTLIGDPTSSGDQIVQTITNKRDQKFTGIAVQKQWKDAAGNYITDPDVQEIEVTLYQQKGKKVYTDKHTVNITFPHVQQSYTAQVEDDVLKYTIEFWHDSSLTADDLFSKAPETYKYEATGTTSYCDSLSCQVRKAIITGTVPVHTAGTTDITFVKNDSVKIASAAQGYGGVDKPQISAEYQQPQYSVTWYDPVKYPTDNPVKLTSENKWYKAWSNLPADSKENGTEYVYRYYVVETVPEGYTVRYDIGGTSYEPAAGQAVNMEGITQGTILITNTSQRTGVELPNTGGEGTIPYTTGGLALCLLAACLLYIKRRRAAARA